MTIVATRQQARRFLLLKHGLLGEHRFAGKDGVMDFFAQTSFVQFDPIDMCGRSPELTLFSRVRGFEKSQLDALLYTERKLVDYFDKNLGIMQTKDWKYYARIRAQHAQVNARNERVLGVKEQALAQLQTMEFASPKDLGLEGRVDWAWSVNASLGRAVLEQLYFEGKLCIHHKKGTIRFFSLASKFIDEAILLEEDPNKTDAEFLRWQFLRRLGAVGLLPAGPSDAFLCMKDFRAEQRQALYRQLLDEKELVQVQVDGLAKPLFMRSEDMPTMEKAQSGQAYAPRLELIAPLDGFMWDRNVIQQLFDFYYRWEIYTPKEKRQYGYYVLPILYGEKLVGRVEPVCRRKEGVLEIEGIWYEEGFKPDAAFKKMLKEKLSQLAGFNGMKELRCNVRM